MEQQPSVDAPHILIVDDSLKSRLLIETLLRAQGYTDLTSVDSAREALLALNLGAPAGSESAGFDLILMDLLMPEMDGIQACHQIKSDPRFLDVPIIMVTAEESTESLKEAFDAGAIDYVNKTGEPRGTRGPGEIRAAPQTRNGSTQSPGIRADRADRAVEKAIGGGWPHRDRQPPEL